jgi:hypothetical protein
VAAIAIKGVDVDEFCFEEGDEFDDVFNPDDVFGYLFWDVKNEKYLWATDDDFSRNNILKSFDDLEIKVA